MRQSGLWVGVLAAFALFAGCDHRGETPAQPVRGEDSPWRPDPSLHDPVPPANPLPEPSLEPDGTLHAIWAYETPNEVHFHGITDEAGNLYWIERTAEGSLEVVSLDWDGLERWRSAVAGRLPPSVPDGILLVAGHHALIVLRDQDGPTCARDTHLVALRAADGTLAWRQNLGADIPPEPAFYLSCTADARQPAASDDALFVSVTRCTRSDDCRTSLEGLEIASGARRFAQPLARSPSPTASTRPAVDEAGDVHVAITDFVAGEVLVVDPAGAVRSRSPNSWALQDLSAVASGVAVGRSLRGGGIGELDAATGAAVVDVAIYLVLATPIGISGTAIFSGAPDGDRTLRRTRLGSTSPDWSVPTAMPDAGTHSFVLTSAGTILLTRCRPDGAPGGPSACLLQEFDVAGYEHLRVPLPAGFGASGASLHDGRWVTAGDGAVRSFDLPGRRVCRTGWVTTHGSVAGDRRSR